MSRHGHGGAKNYGTRPPLGKVKIGEITDEVARLARAEPGTPEYFDVLRGRAAKLARELRALNKTSKSNHSNPATARALESVHRRNANRKVRQAIHDLLNLAKG